MNKKYTLLIAIGSTMTIIGGIVVPVSIVYSHKEHKKLPHAPNAPTSGPQNPIVIIPEKHTFDISAVPKNLSMYSFDSLLKESKELKDTTEWVGGIEYHAASSAIAFIRNLAESYGYSTEIDPTTKKTAHQNFMDRNNYKWIDDTEAAKIVNDSSTPPDVKLGVIGVSVKSTSLSLQQKRNVLQSIGKDGGMSQEHDDAVNITSGHLENYNLDSPNPLFGSDQFTVYPDYRTNKTNIEIYSAPQSVDVTNTIRQLYVPGIIDPYPTLTDEQLNKYAPLMKFMLNQFLLMYQGNEDLALMIKIAPEICDQIGFLVQKNLVQSVDKDGNQIWTLKIDDEQFFEHLKMLNNGSTHWLAIKAVLCGLDSSFASKDTILFTGDKFWPSDNIDPKNGIKDIASIMGLMSWGGRGRLVLDNQNDNLALMPIDSKHSYPATFVSGKTVDELYNINGITPDKRKEITQKVEDLYKSKGW